jgi:hypothetical protein
MQYAYPAPAWRPTDQIDQTNQAASRRVNQTQPV